MMGHTDKISAIGAECCQTDLLCRIAATIFGSLLNNYDREIRDNVHNGDPDWREALSMDAVKIASYIIENAEKLTKQ
jgi:hypothetical protein